MKIRIRFSKVGRIRWTSHRDVARMWERGLRRARLPLRYSEGFSPRPQLSFGLALPTGCESLAEYLDVTLGDDAELHTEELRGHLSEVLPDGLDVVGWTTLRPGRGSVQEEVTSCSWEIELPAQSVAEAEAAVRTVRVASTLPLPRVRKGRTSVDDLRPSLLAIDVTTALPGTAGAQLRVETATRPRGVRPQELAHVLKVGLGPARRTAQWIERDGHRWEPLDDPSDSMDEARRSDVDARVTARDRLPLSAGVPPGAAMSAGRPAGQSGRRTAGTAQVELGAVS